MIIVPGFYFTHECDHCKRFIECRLFGVYSALGPSALICDKCGRRSEIDRSEWADFPFSYRIMYCVTSLVYAVLGGFVGGIFCVIWYHVGIAGDAQKNIPFQEAVQDPALHIGAIAGAILILAIQILRIRRSLQRTITDAEVLVPITTWNLEMNLQMKFAVVFVLMFPTVLLTAVIRSAIIFVFS